MDPAPVAGLLLAAGAGRRMGTPKALLRTRDGAPFVSTALRALFDGGCGHVTIVVGAAADDVRRLLAETGWLADPGVRLVLAADWAEGMGASLRKGLGSLSLDHDAVVVDLVDLPDVSADVVRRVVVRVGAAPSALGRATYDGRPGHPVLLGRDHWAGVAAVAEGDQGARSYLSSHDVVSVECSDLATGRDVDRPDQLEPD